MLVYVINKQKLISFTLPSKIYGSYWITDTDAFNNERNLINISEYDGKWAAFSNKTVKIIADNKTLRSAYLEDYQFLLLQVEDQPGFLVLYTCPVNDQSMHRVALKHDMDITIGSANDNTIICHNQLISSHHLQLTYQKNTWLLQDLNSQYGTFVNNKAVTGTVRLYHGDVIFVMGLKLIVLGNTLTFNNPLQSVVYDEKAFAPLTELAPIKLNDTLEEIEEITLYNENDYFIRSPRFMEVIDQKQFQIEDHPSTEEPEEMPFLLTLGPMITMGSTSFVMLLVAFMSMQDGNRSTASVLPTIAISISMLAGTLLWPTINRSFQKKQRQKKIAKIEKKYSEYLVKKEKELLLIAAEQKQILLSNNISPLECYQLIVNRSRTLWGRELPQKDFLSLRLGIGSVPLNVKFEYPLEKFRLEEDQLSEKMRLLVEKNKKIEGAPITESLVDKNIMAITGKYEYIKPYTDLLLLQMIALHSYYDLKIVILTSHAKAPYWEYMKLMPHCFSDDKEMRFFVTNFDDGKEVSQYLQKILIGRKDKTKKATTEKEKLYRNFGTYYVIITDDYKAAKEYSIIDEVLSQDGNLGFSLLILHPSLANLPTACKAFIGLNNLQEGAIFENELSKDSQREFTIEKVDKVDMQYCSLRLSNIPIENKDENYVIPKAIGFLEMYDVGRIEQLNPLERWKVNDPILSLAVPIGVSMKGKTFKLDLHEKEEGPHGLIAGMTGSGKSEFIITYILSMAINFHPNEVQFVLIDYKGGGLVGAFENKETGIKLPHLAGTITNLDTADINRALASIESELKRRQMLFNKARSQLGEGTIDIYKYQKYYREGLLETPVSHLFIISDEFAELKSQQPEFMDQLISTARIGRSLGVHLILATQKPSGVVNDQIWSNSRFRVCLKVQEATDSNEVIKRPDAAALKEVGRFYLQVGYDELFAMGQAAWAGAPYIPQDKVYHEVDDSISFINNIGKSMKTIALPKKDSHQSQGEQLPLIVKYLDKVAKEESVNVRKLWLEKLPATIFLDALKKKYHFRKTPFITEAIIGEYDHPENQSQGLLTLDLTRKGNAVIYSMNEKNTIINTILCSFLTTYDAKELNLYLMDFDSETLKIYQTSPQVGDVVFSNESEKVEKLLKLLLDEIEKRKKLFQDYNGNYEFYCRNSGTTLPSIVVILTGYETFKETYEEKDMTFSKISRDGVKYGIYTIITAITDRAIRLSMRTNYPQIIPLKLSAPIEYNMLLGKKAPMIADIEGRGVALVGEEPYEFQTAMVCENNQLNTYVKTLCQDLKATMTEAAPMIPVLPAIVTLEDLLPHATDMYHIPIGIEEESLKVATLDITRNLITLINSDDIEAMKQFSLLLIREVNQSKLFQTAVVDLKHLYQEEILSFTTYISNLETAFESLDTLIFSPREEPLLIFMTGIEKLMDILPSEIKSNFQAYLTKVQEQGHCYFIFLTRLGDIKTFAYDPWFRQFVSLDTGLWIGRGLNNSTIHNLVTPLRLLSFPLPSNFGFNLEKGIATRVKLLEGVISDGE